jgi:methionyl-tRNA synthetase
MEKQKDNITFDDLLKLDVRICEVIHADRVPKTDKLLKLTIKTGIDEREVVTNIGSQYEPDELIGLSFPFVLNLEPMTMRGIESRAMILAAAEGDGVFLLDTDAEVGSVVL